MTIREKTEKSKKQTKQPTIRFIPDKKDQTNGELLVYDARGKLKFVTPVYNFNPMEVGMKHYCCDLKMVHCIPSDHLCDEDMIEVWI